MEPWTPRSGTRRFIPRSEDRKNSAEQAHPFRELNIQKYKSPKQSQIKELNIQKYKSPKQSQIKELNIQKYKSAERSQIKYLSKWHGFASTVSIQI